jgi:PKD repeat protein
MDLDDSPIQQAKRMNHWARCLTPGRGRVTSHPVRRTIGRTARLLSLLALGLVMAQVVVAAPPSASFTISDPVLEIGQSVSFSATVTDPDVGDTHTLAWDFGDGNSGSGENPSHSYGSPGDKTVTLTVIDSPGGETSTATERLHVNAPPTAAFHFTPANPNPNQTITFISDSSDPEGGVSHAWDLDNDGSFDDGSDASENWSFPTGGNKTVRLRVTDGDGAMDVITQAVSVFQNSPPAARFNVAGSNAVTPDVPDVGETVTFTSTATDPNGNGTIARRDWDLDDDGDFDDGSGVTAQRSFTTPGIKTVGLLVTDTSGATDSTTRTFRVKAPPAAATQTRPLTRLPDVVIDINGSVTGAFTRVRLLRVQAPTGATMLVICRGKRCPKRVSKRGKGRAVRFRAFERRFRAGTKLIVRTTKPGFIGRQSTWTMRSGKRPKRVNRCLVPGVTLATKCPAP